MKYYKVRELSKKQAEEIEIFVKAHPNAAYFQSTLFFYACRFSDLLTPFFYLAYRDTDTLAGVMLVFRQVQYKWFPFDLLSSRNIIWGGPLVENNELEIYKGIYALYEKDKPLAIYTQVRNLSDQTLYLELMQTLHYRYEDHLNIIIDLNKSEEQLWQELNSKRRNEIRKAIKEDTVVELINTRAGLETCYVILQEVYRRAKLPLPKFKHFEALLQTGTERDGLRVFVAKFDNKIIGCMICLAYGDTLFDYYAGAYQENYDKHPNDLIPWEVFKWAKHNGFTKFDFGGAGKPGVPYGVRDYKKKFGGTLVNDGRFEKIHFPKLYKTATLAFQAWKYFKK